MYSLDERRFGEGRGSRPGGQPRALQGGPAWKLACHTPGLFRGLNQFGPGKAQCHENAMILLNIFDLISESLQVENGNASAKGGEREGPEG